MHKSKDIYKEITISRGFGEGEERLPFVPWGTSSSFNSGIKTMLSYPAKLRDSLKKLGRSKSMQLVLEGAHDPKDEQLVESFRELLFIEGQLPGKYSDYHTLLRFLRKRDFDFSKAKETFLNYLKWRRNFRVDMIPKEFKFEEFEDVKKCYHHGYHGVDRLGRPVYIERVGMVDLNKLFQLTTIERFVKYHVSEQEKTINLRYPACSVAAKRHISSTTSIVDVNGVGMSNFSKQARSLFLEIQKIDSNYYPETLHRLFIINAGSGFKMLWKALKAFLDARTVAKIRVLGYDYLRALLEIIDPSNLPIFLGGNCTCSDYGGCLLSDKGPWKNPEILELLQTKYAAEEMYSNGGNGNKASEDAPVLNMADIENKDSSTKSTSRHEEPALVGSENAYKLASIKIKGLEAALRDTKNKIEALEAALEETKMVLKGLAQHLEEECGI
ncbi:Phosphatidylinositol/phosphatidylcholine transfer protein [Quillaja saponaria]|uniref:Phosphatidylinositol/phosphatidylcholine transfer protein n=1 Tax=Quillaja saponaria TaxID=32244 RepID=A0AAD7PEA9_QUISA|nr:Phosphatidylinositol/phosphatidylcholine transfer protein [Quillaja saponaria]